MKNNALGKGLEALIGDKYKSSNNISNPGYYPDLAIDRIVPNPFQPRMKMDDDRLLELAESIKENGIIEPLIVTKGTGDKFEIIAGERRWRAAKIAKLDTVPVVVKEASKRQMLELAVIENIQRADLNPLEEAIAFYQLHTQFNVTYGEIADKIGFSRPAVANKVRLMNLPDPIKQGLLDEVINEGHAKALLAVKDDETMIVLFHKVIKEELNVREIEEIVKKLNEDTYVPSRKNERIRDDRTKLLENTLKDFFKEKDVYLHRTMQGGFIKFPYQTEEELDNLMKKLGVPFRIN
ncbi:MAG: ParB/RepB/Spo0J family partition protein [bacterium]